jgi:hypothetical protein
MIELSVVIPMFRAKYIGWLPFESLIRQRDIDFEWELIIAEEMYDEALGEKEIYKYKERLEELGCIRFKYIGLKKWISLGEKLHLLAQSCSDSSKVFVWHAADYYSASLRLKTHYDIFLDTKKIHLHLPTKAIYYNISSEKLAIHDTTIRGRNSRKDDCIGKAWCTNTIKKVPKEFRKIAVDGWLFANVKKIIGKDKLIIHFDKSDNWKHALSTHGFHNLTHQRDGWINKLKPPFYECNIDINKAIPKEILERLKQNKENIKKHKKGFPKK